MTTTTSPCANPWPCTNTATHHAPRGCVHESTTGSSLDAEPTEEDR